ncbi:hypothetical protein HUN92_13660 [Bacillus firmus]|uniref:hypothetical protein n=1 Tax=Cytobacillus firmus TaxID=1399 RepID=UPI00157FE310|nr:hypothetical protein [Cytobacillus firmus]NUH84766.1 hypothetical protein [Cytobacillus firmus]
MDNKTVEITENHIYQVLDYKVYEHDADADEVGELTLLHMNTQEIEEFTIWNGDYPFFYVCLPTNEDEEDPNEVYDLQETFDINLLVFTDLNKDGKKVAVNGFLEDAKFIFEESYTFRQAYKTLKSENRKHLYLPDGVLVSNGGMY